LADIRSIQSDLSNAVRSFSSTSQPMVPVSSGGAINRPVDTIRAQAKQDSTLGLLRFPLDQPKYYMTLDIQAYSRTDLLSVGHTTNITTIALPLPAKMVDTQSVGYEQKAFSTGLSGMAVHKGMGTVQSAIGQAVDGNFRGAGKTIADSITSANSATGSDYAVAGGFDSANKLDQAGGLGVTNAVRAASGYSPNYFLTVLLDGPQYKTHNLNWSFSPRTPAESEQLNRIIRVMNNAQAPGLGFGGAVFTFPRVFRIAYRPNTRYLYKFKPAVLVNFTVDYTGGGMPAFYRSASSTHGQNAPVQINIQCTFLELEFWLRSDFGDDEKLGSDPSGLSDAFGYSAGTSRAGPNDGG
jgi:hypothetical protein